MLNEQEVNDTPAHLGVITGTLGSRRPDDEGNARAGMQPCSRSRSSALLAKLRGFPPVA